MYLVLSRRLQKVMGISSRWRGKAGGGAVWLAVALYVHMFVFCARQKAAQADEDIVNMEVLGGGRPVWSACCCAWPRGFHGGFCTRSCLYLVLGGSPDGVDGFNTTARLLPKYLPDQESAWSRYEVACMPFSRDVCSCLLLH